MGEGGGRKVEKVRDSCWKRRREGGRRGKEDEEVGKK